MLAGEQVKERGQGVTIKRPRHEAGSCTGSFFVLVVGCFINWRTELNSPVQLWKVSLYDFVNKSVNNINRFFIP